MTVSEDQRYVAIAGWDNGAAIYDLHTEKVLWAKRPKDEVSTKFAHFSKDGKTIYTGGTEGAVYGIDVLTGEVKSKRWATPTGETIYGFRIMAMAVSLDGRWLAAGTGPEGTVYVWDLNKPANAKPRVLKHGQLSILVLQFSPTSDHVVALGEGMKVWKLE
jgi:WD40 repeat protein